MNAEKDLSLPAQILTLPIYHTFMCNSMHSFLPKKFEVQQLQQLQHTFSIIPII